MRKIKKSLSLLLVLLLIPAVLAGCKPKVASDESAKILFDFAVKGDKANLSKIGGTQKDFDEGKKEEKDSFTSQVKSSLSASGFSISDEQVNDMYDALMNSLKKVNETTSVVSEDGKTAEVKIKTTYIDLKGLVSKAQQDALAQAKSSNITDETQLKAKFIDVYVKDLVSELNNAKPETNTKEQNFKFVIKDGQWLPENFSDFYKKVGSLTYQS